MKKLWNQFGLTIVLTLFFLGSLIGQIYFGFHAFNEERIEDKLKPLNSIQQYIVHGHFLSSLAENWESEFLQMMIFVWLTVFLYQKGSAESKSPPSEQSMEEKKCEKEEEKYSRAQKKKWPVLWRIYENSLVLSLLLLFILSFFIHVHGHFKYQNEKNMVMGKPLISYTEVLGNSEFWFESFQNWQSEFFSIALLGVLSIFLRQKHSPQSKMLRSSNSDTGPD